MYPRGAHPNYSGPNGSNPYASPNGAPRTNAQRPPSGPQARGAQMPGPNPNPNSMLGQGLNGPGYPSQRPMNSSMIQPQNRSLPAGSARSMLPPAGSTRPPNQAPGSPQPNHGEQNRRNIADKLVQDCYSHMIVAKNGKRVPEVSYQTHLSITEYSSFPSTPPPDHLAPSQLGSIKPRVLVICVKHSGRVLLQKGKFNDSKNIYQIGRTWDLDELKAITRVGHTGIILSINKDYYWRVDEGMERIWKFVRFLTNAYGGFVGRYPEPNGFTIQELNLPPTPAKKQLNSPSLGRPDSNNNSRSDISLNEPVPNPALMSSKSLKRKNMPNPLLPQPPNQQQSPPQPDHYKSFDFTSNGQLPAKPMNVISSDRGQSVENTTIQSSVYQDPYATPTNKTNSASYQTNSSYSPQKEEDTSNDSHSFVFNHKEPYSPERLHEYAKDVRETSPLRNFKPRNSGNNGSVYRKVSDGFANSASLASQLENQLENNEEDNLIREFGKSLPKPNKASAMTQSPDFGIEEITDESDVDTPEQTQPSKFPNKNVETEKGLGINNSHGIIGESTNIDDTTMQEIEDMLDSQLSFGGAEGESYSREEEKEEPVRGLQTQESPSKEPEKPSTKEKSGYSLEEDESLFNSTTQVYSGLNINKKEVTVPLEKDSEIEEFLEEVNWSILDTSDSLVKKLNKELNSMKHKNIERLVGLDFRRNDVSNDIVVSIGEIDNLSHIFKKMELDFKFLARDINQIEEDSQGLQVKSINKKILFKDLQNILQKVSLNHEELRAVEEFRDFDRLNKLESLELKLLRLFEALGTVRNEEGEEDNDFSAMKALTQYKEAYEKVSTRFIKHFNNFICQQFMSIIVQLKETLSMFRPNNLLRELSNCLIYSGVTYYIKEVDLTLFNDLNDFFNHNIEAFLDDYINMKIKKIKFTTGSPSVNTSTPSSPSSNPVGHLRKSRTLRLSRKVSKLGGGSSTNIDDSSEQLEAHMENMKKYSTQNANEIEDPKVIMEIIEESKDLITYVQFFVCSFFHYDKSNTNLDFNEFMRTHPYSQRRELLDDLPHNQLDRFNKEKIYSTTELIADMTSIFGGYINTIMKKINPVELNLPMILVYLERMLQESNAAANSEYLSFNFLKKLIDKYKNGWNKFIKSQLELLNKSMIIVKGGILPGVKNINQLIVIIESSLENVRADSVRGVLDKSYEEITEGLVTLCVKDDPLLKNHEFDDKEREYRNITILQNIYFVTEQLAAFNTTSLQKMRLRLEEIFRNVETSYFQRIIHKNIGKLAEFVANYEALEKMNNGRPKKYNKKFIKTLLHGYTSKDLHVRVEDIYKKFERHFLVGKDMFEKDLFERVWKDMEEEFVGLFKRLDRILREGFDDVEWNVGVAEVRQMFRTIH